MASAIDANAVEEVIKHIPRAYQEELFIQAQRSNVIATLDTGSGKTFIAALLIKWICALPSSLGKKVVFLVPKVPLVDQHCDFLSTQTCLIIRGYKGAMGVDSWDGSRWRKEFMSSDVLVMTAQIFKNILTHAYWNMNDVSLLVFDECHHTVNDHPYNVIMRDHHLPCIQRPKIFGMTASPIWNPRDPIMSLQALQRNLLSKVIAVRDHIQELLEHTHKPVEVVLRYSGAPVEFKTYHRPSLWELLKDSKDLHVLGIRRAALSIRYDVALKASGPAGADYFIFMLITSKLKNASSRDHVRARKLPDFAAVRNATLGERTHPKKNVKPGILDKLFTIMESFGRLLSNADIPSEWLSPKLRATIKVLVKHRTENFQGIIFVEQRHIASILAWILPRTTETKDWVRCSQLTGHGEADSPDEGVGGMTLKAQRDVVRSFKNGDLNLLIATSVAEEGLDFPACQLVVRFDRVHNMVGYVQSRGRARQQASTFVVMMEESDDAAFAQFQVLQSAEPELKSVYQTFNSLDASMGEEEEAGPDEIDVKDVAERESYVISSTGATLTYNSAISLLDHLCSIIPRDEYTPVHEPVYTDRLKDGFHCELRLPNALPLSKEQLHFNGPLKHSKKEAKRAVAFMAVRQLHILGVFDDHLSPVISTKGDAIKDADGRPIIRVDDVPPLMDVHVVSPWKLGLPWYLQIVNLGGRTRAGFLSGAIFPAVRLRVGESFVELSDQNVMTLELNDAQFQLVQRYMKMGLFWCVTASPIDSPLACYLVPMSATTNDVDWKAMECAVADEFGSFDWSTIGKDHEGHLLLTNCRRFGHPLVLRRFRPDLSLDDHHDFDPDETDYLTYGEYFAQKMYPVKINGVIVDSSNLEGPILEVTTLRRRPFAVYTRDAEMRERGELVDEEIPFLVPRSYCRWLNFSVEMAELFAVLSPLCQYIQDLFRARAARNALHLPPITDSLSIEALTSQDARAGFDNQRLETLGDGVLKLAVVVYLFNRFPYKHEGQLDRLKINSISNRFLLTRAKAIGLEHYISGETRIIKTWQFVVEDSLRSISPGGLLGVQRILPRRNLQDCMEALLGASFLTGGINMALEAGTALGLCFGGPLPWSKRYMSTKCAPVPAQFKSLELFLGYQFKNGELLPEAFTHPSFENSLGTCYQRLEFLGDALVGLVVTNYVFNKFPHANSGQITRARDKVVCNSTQAAIAVRKLALHKYLLANNVRLNKEISKEDTILSSVAYTDIVADNWRFDPPKVLGDIFESVIGAVFVDSGFDYDIAARVVEGIMEDVLSLLHSDTPLDPVSSFYVWIGKSGCQKVRFERVQSNPLIERRDSIIVLVHGKVVAGPVLAANISLAKGLASKDAKATLSDESSELAINRLCNCMSTDTLSEDELPLSLSELSDLSDETEEGFSRVARLRTSESPKENSYEKYEDKEHQEVEMLLCSSTPSQLSSILEDDIS